MHEARVSKVYERSGVTFTTGIVRHGAELIEDSNRLQRRMITILLLLLHVFSGAAGSAVNTISCCNMLPRCDPNLSGP